MKPSPLAVFILLLTAACAGGERDDAATIERTDSAGVTIVRNAGGDRVLSWKFVRKLSLGGADEGAEAFYRIAAGFVAADAGGNLYVLDSGNHRVVVFDSAGEYLRTMGKEGGGPGEMQIAAGMHVAADGRVSVLDLAKGSLVRWDPAGEVLPTRPIDAPMFGGFALAGDSMIAPVPSPTALAGEDLAEERLLVMWPGDTTVLAALSLPRPKMISFGCVGLSLPPLFTPSLLWGPWDAVGNRIAVAPGIEYVVNVHQGNRVSSVRRALPPRPVTKEMALAEVGEERTVTFDEGILPVRLRVRRWSQAGLRPRAPRSRRCGARARSVALGVKGEAAIIDVFDPAGEYRGTLPAGSPWPVAFTPSGDVIVVETDDLDVERVVVFAVERP